jgi:O-acetyl-ADP-ribose deacetylase (regulator of RNase III)
MVQINDTQYVANLFGQATYGREAKRYTSYDAVYESLVRLMAHMTTKQLQSVAFPYKMSSDRGGADWDVILAMIESVFKNTNISIEIWELEQS